MTSPQRLACDDCLRRSRLIADLSGHLDTAWQGGAPVEDLLAMTDRELLAGLVRDRDERRALSARWRGFEPECERDLANAAATTPVCSHQERYPRRMSGIAFAPAVLHVAGSAERLDPLLGGGTVAIVGARRATDYGLEVARSLGRGLAGAGVTVISGMALGVDAAAHAGALELDGPTVAVLGAGPDRPYPASKRALHRRLVAAGCVISEMPAGTEVRRWCFPARNRIIAALADATVVVEAAARSGALITARIARDLGREVAAVPGRVTSPQAIGTNALLFDGAHVVRDAQDALDLLFGAGAVTAEPRDREPDLEPGLRDLLDAVARGRDTVAALIDDASRTDAVLAGLAELELLGRVRRGAGGRYVAVT